MKKGTVTLGLESYDAMMEELNAYRSSMNIETYTYDGKLDVNGSFYMNEYLAEALKKQLCKLGLDATHEISKGASRCSSGLYGIISEKKEE